MLGLFTMDTTGGIDFSVSVVRHVILTVAV